MQVVSLTDTALQVDAGTAPPVGGGFEVRRRDWSFGMGADQDLVLRSPVRSFSIPRAAQVERYYVRMYDGSTPPQYSRLSSAVFTTAGGIVRHDWGEARMTEFEGQVLADLSVLKSQMEHMMGIGQPGRLTCWKSG